MFELTLLGIIYAIWIVLLVNAMTSSEEISLTVSTLPFIVTFPISLLIASSAESVMPGVFVADVLLSIIVGLLLFVRWVMAVVGE